MKNLQQHSAYNSYLESNMFLESEKTEEKEQNLGNEKEQTIKKKRQAESILPVNFIYLSKAVVYEYWCMKESLKEIVKNAESCPRSQRF